MPSLGIACAAEYACVVVRPAPQGRDGNLTANGRFLSHTSVWIAPVLRRKCRSGRKEDQPGEGELTVLAQRFSPMTLTIASLAGTGISLFYYLAPMTGVTRTGGALLVVCSSILLALAGAILVFRTAGGFALLLRVLAVLGTLGTSAAAWFLHEYWLVAAMAIALAATVMTFASARGDADR